MLIPARFSHSNEMLCKQKNKIYSYGNYIMKTKYLENACNSAKMMKYN